MSLWVILILAVVVVLVAYALGMAARARSDGPQARKAPPPVVVPNRPKPIQRPAQNEDERQVQALTNWLLTQAWEQTGVRVANEKLAYERITEAARKAVEALKQQPSVTVSLPFLTADAGGPKHFETQITREVLEELGRY